MENSEEQVWETTRLGKLVKTVAVAPKCLDCLFCIIFPCLAWLHLQLTFVGHLLCVRTVLSA